MVEFVCWALAVFGLANGISTSNFLTPSWCELKKSSNPILSKLGTMLLCPMCSGFWIGGFFHIFFYKATEHIFLDMCIGSAVSWLLYNMCFLCSKGKL